jgi:hypothetical protein
VDAVVVARGSALRVIIDLVVVGVVKRDVTEFDWSAGPTTGIAASVTIVRAAPDEGSVKLTIIIPTAAT